ncbi:MAG: DUF2269 family protein [Gemmatimonadales bacterium]|nr:DUF2269 family protein [Gemmatimonadales bacterium]NIN12910.1 DUF2269 family protein [Gemmatimonadales bacterium]NIR00197.1 DUF2269 family protein [Gemmatimonadales bacterium]NIS65990.1 DUF2269 family protein [Gemmatimonadales bacterium]
MALVLFIHLLGSALWIGGGIAAMVIAIGVRGEVAEVRAGVFRLLARVHTMVIGLGALLAVASGVLLTMSLTTSDTGESMQEPRMWVMQVSGLLGGLTVLFVGLPTAVRMGGLAVTSESGELPPAFETYRKRQAVVSSVAGVLAIIALFAWEVL